MCEVSFLVQLNTTGKRHVTIYYASCQIALYAGDHKWLKIENAYFLLENIVKAKTSLSVIDHACG